VLRLDGGAPVYLAAGNAQDFLMFELELVLERGIVVVEETGFVIRRRPASEDIRLDGNCGVKRGDWAPTRYGEALVLALDNLQQAVRNGVPLISSGETALAAIAICEALRSRAPGFQSRS
jgi:hypothetical protein